MLRRITTAGLAAAFVVGFSTIAWAQGRGGMSMGSGMSAFGSSGFGSTGFGSTGMGGFGSTGFGGGGMGGFGSSGFGGSGFGSSGFGGSGFGNSAFGGNSAMGRSGFGSGMYGGQGGGQNFIGRDSGDMSALNQMGRAGTQFFNQMNRNMGGRNRNTRNQQNAQSSENARSAVRVQLNVAFDQPRPTSSVVANTVRTRLANILPAQGFAQPEVTVDGDVVVLRGVAASENQRLVFEKLIALEPGVMRVRNEMTVASSTSDENR